MLPLKTPVMGACTLLFLLAGLPGGGEAQAAPRLIKAFLADSGDAARARPRSTSVRPGEKIHFYFKVGPLLLKRGKGAPFKTRLVVRVGGKVAKDFGWHAGNAARKAQMKTNGKITWYHNVAWGLTMPKTIRASAFEAVITFHEVLTNSNVTIPIAYQVVAGGQGKVASRPSAGKQAAATPRNPLPPGPTVTVAGKVSLGRKRASSAPVRAYLVSDLASGRVVLVAETKTNARGEYRLKLPPGHLYSIKAGVSEKAWRKGKGLHGGTLVDLSFPEEARNADIPLEKLR